MKGREGGGGGGGGGRHMHLIKKTSLWNDTCASRISLTTYPQLGGILLCIKQRARKGKCNNFVVFLPDT